MERTKRPIHQWEMLRADFQPANEVIPPSLAAAFGVSRQTVREVRLSSGSMHSKQSIPILFTLSYTRGSHDFLDTLEH